MSGPNLDDLSKSWQALLESATVDRRPPDRLGMTGIWAEEDGWHFRPKHEIEVRVPAGATLERLREGLARASLVGTTEVDRAIVLGIGTAKLSGQAPDWLQVEGEIQCRLSCGVATVALGGIRSSETDADGLAAPLLLGDYAVAGHLDPSLDHAAGDLARRHGLPGYRFGDDSWWTEDFLGAKEDPTVGQEHLDEVMAAESWPWLAILVATPASGVASEAAAIAAAQALLGALILLDQPPGAAWIGAVPWIAGGLGPAGEPRWPGDESCDWVLPIDPQHVDGMARRLDNAENELGSAPARVLDLATHARGPGGGLLVAVIESSLCVSGASEHLARGCRLAWLASATDTASTRWALARGACSEICSAGGEQHDPPALARTGGAWRRESEACWPAGNPYGPDGNLVSWEEGLADAAGQADLPSPSWGGHASRQAHSALDLAQACFLGLAAR